MTIYECGRCDAVYALVDDDHCRHCRCLACDPDFHADMKAAS